MSNAFEIRKIQSCDLEWIRSLIRREWGSIQVVSRGISYNADSLPGFIAEVKGIPEGLLTYNIKRRDCEIVTLNSLIERHGIGTALIDAVKKESSRIGCNRIWLITTNDNVNAIRFYQKAGFSLVAVHRNAIEASRRLKPEIPLVGLHGIPIRDEIEFELML